MTRWNNTVGRYQKVVMVKAKKVTSFVSCIFSNENTVWWIYLLITS